MKIKDYNKLSKEERKKLKFKDWPKVSQMGCLFTVVSILILLIIGLFSGNKINNTKSNGIDSTSLYYYSKEMAKKYVTENLKAPSTAKFTDENIHIGLERDSSVVVKISVDAQNTFGAMFRNDFYLKMKWSKKFDDTDNWVLIDIQNETE